MNELVKYNNEMNKIYFTGFTKVHMDLFLAICAKVKNHKRDTIFLNAQELKEIIHFEKGGKHDFFDELYNMTGKLHAINGSIVDRSQGKGRRKFSHFKVFEFEYDESTGLLEVQIGRKFSWLLNEFENYTIFELEEFVQLKSKYSKHLYRLLKQWRTVGKYTFHDLEEFRKLLDFPSKYSNKYLKERCIDVAVAEIQQLKTFKNFKCIPIYASKRGRPLEKLTFTWTPETVPAQCSANLPEEKYPEKIPTEKQKPVQLQGQDSFSNTQTFDEYMKAYTGDDKPSAVAIKIAQDIEKGNKKKKAEPKKNSFNDFHQRMYTQEFWDEFERMQYKEYEAYIKELDENL